MVFVFLLENNEQLKIFRMISILSSSSENTGHVGIDEDDLLDSVSLGGGGETEKRGV